MPRGLSVTENVRGLGVEHQTLSRSSRGAGAGAEPPGGAVAAACTTSGCGTVRPTVGSTGLGRSRRRAITSLGFARLPLGQALARACISASTARQSASARWWRPSHARPSRRIASARLWRPPGRALT